MDLSGQVLVVTGAGGALGQAVVATLRGYGAKIALLSHSPATANLQSAAAWHYGGIAGGLKWEKLGADNYRQDMPQADFKRWVTTNEAAEVIAFLVSDKASAVTGALIPLVGRV